MSEFAAESWFDFDAPMRPTGLRASSTSIDAFHQRVTVAWDKNVEDDLYQYRLFVSEGDGNFVELRTNQTSLKFDIINSTELRVRISAIDFHSNTSLTEGTLSFRAGQAPVQFSDDVFRFYNAQTGVHFYTNNVVERDEIIARLPQFSYEGNSFDAALPGQGDVTVYRFLNTETGTHFFTSNEIERDTVISNLKNYTYEGEAYEAYLADGSGRMALHRFFNTETGTHFYTASDGERDSVIEASPQYAYEGIAYYVDSWA